MRKLGDYRSWTFVDADGVLQLRDVQDRKVRVEFNAQKADTIIDLIPMDADGTLMEDETVFLVSVTGTEMVEFYADGPIALAPRGPVQARTFHGQEIHVEYPDAESLTTIVQRRQRNPELEAMEHRAMLNFQRMIDQNNRDQEAAFERRLAGAEHIRASAAGAHQQEPEPAARAGEPAGGAPADGGEPSSGEGGTEGDEPKSS